MAGPVRVEGLADFQRALRAAGPRYSRALGQTNKAVALQVVRQAQVRARVGGPQAVKAAETLRARAEQRYARIVLGSERVPWALGANFGSEHNLPRRRSAGGTRKIKTMDRALRNRDGRAPAGPGLLWGWNQFPEWGGNQWPSAGGYAKDVFLYWTIRKLTGDRQIERWYGEALDALIADLATAA